MNLREASITRVAFNSWLSGDKQEMAGAQIDLFSTAVTAPGKILPENLRSEAYALSCYRDASRWSFLDRVCERLEKEGASFFKNPADPDSIEWASRLKAIRRDVHKAHAFVRFKKVEADRERLAAWHRPQHDTLDLFVRLFCRRFPKMEWSVVTSDESAHFVDGHLKFGAGHSGGEPGEADGWEDFWRTYYRSIFNPARLMVGAMKKEMPVWHWQTLPESRLIPDLIRGSESRLAGMARKAQSSAEAFLPRAPFSLATLAEKLPGCEGCRLHVHCRPTAGCGNPHAALLLVGEQPGDEEEKQGAPFVGPAGQLLQQAVRESGSDWTALYVTNAVKHFKYQYEGGFRLHKRPERDEVAACRPWLQAELGLVNPRVVVCLGSTAALSVTGRLWPVERYRGTFLPASGDYRVLLTYHPSAILRAADAKKQEYYAALVGDLKTAATVQVAA